MGRGIPVVLDSKSFANKGLAHDFFEEMLNRYVPGERVSCQDQVYLSDLFKRHPDYLNKVGSGVNYFEVISADYGTQCFCAILHDGTKQDFSYIKCITTHN